MSSYYKSYLKSLTNYHDLCYIRICSTILCYESSTQKILGCLALVNVGHVYLLITFNGIDMREIRSQIRRAVNDRLAFLAKTETRTCLAGA